MAAVTVRGMADAATVVLVHGAWHGAWCWDEVVAMLEDDGVTAVAVDLPGHGESGDPFGDLHDDAAAVRRAIDGLGGAPVVLCGHSYGGAVITEAGAHPDVRHLVYLCAFNLDEGETCMTAATDANMASTDLATSLQLDGTGERITIDPDRIVDTFYADCAPDVAAWATSKLGPHPLVTIQQTPTAIAWRDRPSTYAVCTEDRAIHPELQYALAARATHMVEWATSHSPFLSQPDLVAALLATLAREHGP